MGNFSNAVLDMADALLTQGSERVRSGFDKRSLPSLRKAGYLVDFGDGSYSLTAEGMRSALVDLKVGLVEARKYKTPRLEYLEDFMRKGMQWLARRKSTPEPVEDRGGLNAQEYLALWYANIRVVSALNEVRKVTPTAIPIKVSKKLQDLGYVRWTGQNGGGLFPTPAGKALIAEHGDPFHPRTAAARVVARFRSRVV